MPNKYENYLKIKRPASLHSKLSNSQRAAQFAPFAALTGFEEAIIQENRQTIDKPILSSCDKDLLDYTLSLLLQEEDPIITVYYFVYDHYKPGGYILTITSKLIKFDHYTNELVLETMRIKKEDILKIIV